MNTYTVTVDGEKYDVEAKRCDFVPGQGRATFYDEDGDLVATFAGSNVNVFKQSSVTPADGGGN